MTFHAQLAVFWAVVLGGIWILRRFPDHPVSRLALDWRGPYPTDGELLSSFMRRRALYASKWVVQIVSVFLALALLAMWQPHLADTWVFMVFWFALPLLAGTLMLAAILYGISAAKQHVFGPNPRFQAHDDHAED